MVTGAVHGLGEAIAGGFVRAGDRVTCLDIDGDALVEVVEPVDGSGEATAVVADVRSGEDVRSMAGRARRTHGRIDLPVNNAGVKQLTVTGDERPTWEAPVAT